MRHITELLHRSLLFLCLIYPGRIGVVEAGTNAWTSNGPEGDGGGTVVALAIDPSNTSIIYAGTYAGLFRSTNGGGGWSTVNTGVASLGSVHALAIGYSGHPPAGGGVLKSLDGGDNWNAVNTGLPNNVSIGSLAIAPSNTSVIYAGRYIIGGVFKSTNGGDSWNGVNNGMPASGIAGILIAANALAIDPSSLRSVPGVQFCNSPHLTLRLRLVVELPYFLHKLLHIRRVIRPGPSRLKPSARTNYPDQPCPFRIAPTHFSRPARYTQTPQAVRPSEPEPDLMLRAQ